MELKYSLCLPNSDIEVDVTFDYTPYDAGRTSGPPEDCYPPEGGEAEITEVWIMVDDILPYLNDETVKNLTDRCETWARLAQSSGEL